MNGGEPDGRLAPFRTIGVTTAWSASEVQAVLAFLEALHVEITTVHGAELARAYHEQAERDEALDAQQRLTFEETPF